VQLRIDMNNGFSALSFLINRLHNEVMGRFEAIDKRFEAVDKRLDALDVRFDRMDKRFDALDVEIVAIKQRLP
jgi:hypothetical protein